MAWKPPIDYRASAVVTPTPEPFSIGADGVALLAEAPADPANVATPMVVTVGGNARTRVTGTPTTGQYRVRSQSVMYADQVPHTEYLPILEFSAADYGLSGTCNYYRTGTIYTRAMFDSMIAFLRPLSGYASAGDLPVATTDTTQRGCPGDMAFLTNGTLYFSDGTQWFAVAGGAGAQFARTKTVAAGAAVQTSYTKTASADAAVFNQSTKSMDIAANAVILAHQLATVSGDAQVDLNVAHLTQTVSADAAVRGARTSTATADAALKFAVTRTASSDAVVDGGAGAVAFTDNFNRQSSAPVFASGSSYVVGDIVKVGTPALAWRCTQNRSIGGAAPGINAYWERYIDSVGDWPTATGFDPQLLPDSGQATGTAIHSGTFSANQYAECKASVGGTNAGTGTGSVGVGVRMSWGGTGHTAYFLLRDTYSDYDTITYPRLTLYRLVNGTFSALASTNEAEIDGMDYMRLEVTGTGASVSLVAKAKALAGDAWTTLASASYTDTNAGRIVAANPPGFRSGAGNYPIDDWAGGNL